MKRIDLMIIFIFLFLFFIPVVSAIPWWNTSSIYKFDTTPTRYGTVKLNLTNANCESNSTWICGNGIFNYSYTDNYTVRTNIYFVDNDQSGLPLYFYNISGSTAIVFVNFTNLNPKQIYVNRTNRTFNNSLACTDRSVFRFCNDFEGSSIAGNWSASAGTLTQSGNGYLRYVSNTGNFQRAASSYSPDTTGSWAIIVDHGVESTTDGYAYIGQTGTDSAGSGATNQISFGNTQGNAFMQLYTYSGAGTSTSYATAASYWDQPTYVNLEIRKNGSLNTAQASIYTKSNVFVERQTNAVNVPNSANPLGLYGANNLAQLLYFFAVSDYNTSESAFSNFTKYGNPTITIVQSTTTRYSNDSLVTDPVCCFDYNKVKQIIITENYTGSFNISFDIKRMPFGTGTVYGQIYKNGVIYGVEHSSSSLSFTTFTEAFNFASTTYGDTYELYIKDDGSAPATEAQNFRIKFNYDYPNNTPTLINPANGSSQSFAFPPQYGDINFTWSQIGDSGYNILAAKDINFNLPVFNTTVSNPYYTQSIEQGVYYWKVRTFNSGFTPGNWSDTFSFTQVPTTATGVNNSSSGIVYQIINNQISPISGAKVEIYNSTWYDFMITGDNGYYLFQNLDDNTTYTLKATKVDDFDDSPLIPVTPLSYQTITTNILLQKCTSVFTCFYNKQYVTFSVQDIYFNRYSDVDINAFENGDISAYASSITDNTGKATMLLVKSQQYRIEITNSTQGISQTVYIIPSEQYYVIIITPSDINERFREPGNANDNLIITPSSEIINTNQAYINISYLNTTGTISNVTVNITLSNNDGTNTTLNSTSANVSSNTFYYLINGYEGKSFTIWMKILASDNSTILYNFKYGFTFKGIPQNPYSQNITFIGIMAVLLILFVASFFSETTAGIGGLIVSLFAGVLYKMGFMNASWFGNYLEIAISACVVFSIIYLIFQRSQKEGVQ